MLNNSGIKNTIARDQWFDRAVNVQSRHQPKKRKMGEQTVDSDANVSVSSTKTSGWSGSQIIFHGSKKVTNYASDLR